MKQLFEYTTESGFKITTQTETEAEAVKKIKDTVRLIGEDVKPVKVHKTI